MRCAPPMPRSVSARLKVIGEVAAGRPFDRAMGAGEAARIFTGGVIPDGADAVVIQEDTVADGNSITITEAAGHGTAIRPAGVDFREGDVLLSAGRRLTDRDLSLAASMNYPELPVRRRPKVALLATGDELVMPGTTPGPGQIVYSNGYALRALARAEGAETVDLGVAADTMAATTAGIRRARELGADILVTTGGASVGDHDLVKESLEAEGVTIAFWKIAMRPGKPMMHGRLGAMRVIGVPGNPVSSYVCTLAVRGAVDSRFVGPQNDSPRRARPPCSAATSAPMIVREDYLRARLEEREDGTLIATPVNHQDSSLLAKSRCGTGTCDTRAVCAGGQSGRALRDPPAAGIGRRRLAPATLSHVHLKLSGCGTHIEHIVSVHDLFRVLVSTRVREWEPTLSVPENRTISELNGTINRGTCSRCLRANSTNFCVSSTNG